MNTNLTRHHNLIQLDMTTVQDQEGQVDRDYKARSLLLTKRLSSRGTEAKDTQGRRDLSEESLMIRI